MSNEVTVVPKPNIDVAQEREKPRLTAMLFFDFTNRTEEGKLNFLGVFDSIRVSREVKKTHLFGIYIKAAHTLRAPLNITIFSPSDVAVAGLKVEMNEPPPSEHTQMQLSGWVQFDTAVEGHYWVDVSYQEQSLGGSRLEIIFVGEEKKDEHASGDT